MIGIVIIAHGELGPQFINTARLIGLNSEESLLAISVSPTDSPDLLREEVARSIKSVEQGEGVLILTDLFGVPLPICRCLFSRTAKSKL